MNQETTILSLLKLAGVSDVDACYQVLTTPGRSSFADAYVTKFSQRTFVASEGNTTRQQLRRAALEYQGTERERLRGIDRELAAPFDPGRSGERFAELLTLKAGHTCAVERVESYLAELDRADVEARAWVEEIEPLRELAMLRRDGKPLTEKLAALFPVELSGEITEEARQRWQRERDQAEQAKAGKFEDIASWRVKPKEPDAAEVAQLETIGAMGAEEIVTMLWPQPVHHGAVLGYLLSGSPFAGDGKRLVAAMREQLLPPYSANAPRRRAIERLVELESLAI